VLDELHGCSGLTTVGKEFVTGMCEAAHRRWAPEKVPPIDLAAVEAEVRRERRVAGA